MIRSKPLRILSWVLALLLLLLAVLVVVVLTFDWNRARPYINRQVSASTGRVFEIAGDLRVHWRQGLATEPGWRRYVPRPEISADDVRISNPAWSAVGPQMAQAHRVVVALHVLPLLRHHVELTDLAMQAPQLALQRRADGSNSWTLKDNGPSTWQVDIQRLAFTDGTLRYQDDRIALDLRAAVASIADGAAGATAAPSAGAQPGRVDKFGLQFTLGGTYRKAPVSGSGKAGAVLSLQDENTVYPVQAQARLGENTISVDGKLSGPRALNGIDLHLKLGGGSMANLYPLTGVLLPETPPYRTSGQLIGKKEGEQWNWSYKNFTGQVGASDVAGTLDYLTAPGGKPRARPLLRGTIHSQQLRLADLGPAIGADGAQSGAEAQARAAAQPAGKALPVAQFNTEKWGALDADVTFIGQKLVRTHEIPLRDVKAELHMKDKVLSLTPLDFGLAGGNVTSNITLDGRQAAIAAQIKLAARHLKIRELFPNLQSMQASFGEVNADAALTGHGNSISAMLATSNGELGAVVSEGSVSQFILEAAGLNVANAVFVKLFGDKQVHLNCMASEFGVQNGRAGVRQFFLDTDDAVVDITGDVDLALERLNLDVRPKTKGVRIFSLRTPLYAKGTFKDPDVGPYKGPLALKAGAAVALAAVAPLAAVLPLVNIGNVPDSDCAGALAKVGATRRAPVSPATAAPAPRVTNEQLQKAQQKR